MPPLPALLPLPAAGTGTGATNALAVAASSQPRTDGDVPPDTSKAAPFHDTVTYRIIFEDYTPSELAAEAYLRGLYDENGKPCPLDEFYVIGTFQDQDKLFGKDKEERDEFDNDADINDMIDNDGNDEDEE